MTEQAVPVLKMVPLTVRPGGPTVDEVFADVRGKVKYYGDILEPDTADWKGL